MTMRRVIVGMAVVGALGVFAFVRPGGKEAKAHAPAPTAEVTEGNGGNYDDAAHRYKNSQARHWRQVAIGTH